eukprot:COSAG06_NODE_2611_length_6581_cov_21.257443_8_plen_186_part_00
MMGVLCSAALRAQHHNTTTARATRSSSTSLVRFQLTQSILHLSRPRPPSTAACETTVVAACLVDAGYTVACAALSRSSVVCHRPATRKSRAMGSETARAAPTRLRSASSGQISQKLRVELPGEAWSSTLLIYLYISTIRMPISPCGSDHAAALAAAGRRCPRYPCRRPARKRPHTLSVSLPAAAC